MVLEDIMSKNIFMLLRATFSYKTKRRFIRLPWNFEFSHLWAKRFMYIELKELYKEGIAVRLELEC